MTKLIKIVNASTGEEEVREMTEDELARLERIEADNAAEVLAQQQRNEQRKSILDRLGLTEEEAQILLG